MKYFSISDTGKVRKNNEDNYINYSCDDYSLHIVCDGIGGHNAGELASDMAVNIVKKYIVENFDPDNIFDIISESIKNANLRISEYSTQSKEFRGMGTTLVLALIYKGVLYFANVGDSRIYLYKDRNLEQITKDHSYVQELIDVGAITYEEAKFHPRNQITSALGPSIDYKIQIDKISLDKYKYILLTTDGLTDLIDDNDILEVVKEEYDIKETCEILTYMANSTGGYDNITITVIKLGEE